MQTPRLRGGQGLAQGCKNSETDLGLEFKTLTSEPTLSTLLPQRIPWNSVPKLTLLWLVCLILLVPKEPDTQDVLRILKAFYVPSVQQSSQLKHEQESWPALQLSQGEGPCHLTRAVW